jgi:serine phosphatase RsbU (regulator of sigma subunit)
VWRRTPYTAFEEAVFAQVGQLASASLGNTLLYEREHATALTLQSSLMPAQLPSPNGLDLTMRYQPSSAHSGVGGDWCDVIQLPGERTGLVIGDVMGHGVGAAAFMGQLKVAMRAYATEGHSPSEVLDRTDRLIPAIGGERIATVIYAILEPDGRLTYANAGHPPPLVTAPGTSRPFLLTDGLSVPLGTGIIGAEISRPSHQTRLERGSTLLLYTDGLIERRDRSIDEGLDALRALMDRPDLPIDQLCGQALNAAVDQPNQDDICILAVHRPLEA